MPAWTRCSPSVMTLSPEARPLIASQLEPTAGPVSIARRSTLFWAPTTSTLAPPLVSRVTAGCGTRIASGTRASVTWARTNMPGSSVPCGLGNTARMVTAPELGSTVTSVNCSLPSTG